MWIVDQENGIALAGNGHPLGLRCSCGHRALIMQDRLPPQIGPGSMVKIRSLKWVCSKCGSRRIELVMFWNLVQALAFSNGLSYIALWEMRLHGFDTSVEPWCREALKPNLYRSGPHDPEIKQVELDRAPNRIPIWPPRERPKATVRAGLADQEDTLKG